MDNSKANLFELKYQKQPGDESLMKFSFWTYLATWKYQLDW